MKLAIRGIDVQIAHGETLQNDRHAEFKTEYVLANLPFNDSDWHSERIGRPPALGLPYAACGQRECREVAAA